MRQIERINISHADKKRRLQKIVNEFRKKYFGFEFIRKHFKWFKFMQLVLMRLYEVGFDKFIDICEAIKVADFTELSDKEIEQFIIAFAYYNECHLNPDGTKSSSMLDVYRFAREYMKGELDVRDAEARTLEIRRIYEQKILKTASAEPISTGQYIKQYGEKIKFSGNDKKLFHKNNIDQFNDLYVDDFLVELDAMYMTGELTIMEAIRYIQSLPEYKEIGKRMIACANDFVDRLMKKFGSLKLKNSHGFFDKLIFIFNAFESFKRRLNENAPPLRKLIFRRFTIQVEEDLFRRLFELCIQQNLYSPEQAMTIFEKSIISPNDLGEVRCLLEDMVSLRDILDLAANDIVYDFHHLVPSDDKAFEEQHEYIFELANLRRVKSRTVRDRCLTIELTGDQDDRDALNVSRLFNCFDIIIYYGDEVENSPRFDLTIDTFTGELLLGEALQLSEFVPQEFYRVIKAFVYNKIIGFLEESNEEIDGFDTESVELARERTKQALLPIVEEVEVNPKPELADTQIFHPLTQLTEPAIEIEEQSMSINTDSAASDVADFVAPEFQYQPYIKQVEPKLQFETEITTAEQLEKPEKGVKLSGFNGDEVLRVLKIILGEPVRISSSHYFFMRKNGPGCYPISIHGSQKVGVGMLRKCLRHYGILPQEFLNEIR